LNLINRSNKVMIPNMAALKFKYGKILSGVDAAVSSWSTGFPPYNGGIWAQV
jgi:hypothetical protein